MGNLVDWFKRETLVGHWLTGETFSRKVENRIKAACDLKYGEDTQFSRKKYSTASFKEYDAVIRSGKGSIEQIAKAYEGKIFALIDLKQYFSILGMGVAKDYLKLLKNNKPDEYDTAKITVRENIKSALCESLGHKDYSDFCIFH